MDKRRLGNTDIFVTPVGMGVLTVGRTQLNLSVEAGSQIVCHALERGINFLDTAEFYETYPYIKRALDNLASSFSSGALHRPVIVSKSLSLDYNGMRAAIEDCRKALNMDQIDIFLLHEVREVPDFKNRSGAWECLNDAKAKGLVKAVGLSTHHICVVNEAYTTPGIDVIFPLINYESLGIRKGSDTGTCDEMAHAIMAAAENGIGIFTMKAFGGGNLLKDYKKALDYVTSLSGITSTMIGMGCKKDVDDAIAYFENRLPQNYAPDVTNKHMFVDRGDCESCGACVSRCTSKAIHLDNEGIALIDYTKCVLCGYCAPVCPSRALIML